MMPAAIRAEKVVRAQDTKQKQATTSMSQSLVLVFFLVKLSALH
jgi:hypothetical protein